MIERLLEEYVDLRSAHKGRIRDNIKKYFGRVLVGSAHARSEYRRLVASDMEFTISFDSKVRAGIRTMSDGKLLEGIAAIKIHLLGLEERTSFIVVYSALIVALIAVYKLLDELALVLTLFTASSIFIAERLQLNSRIYATKEFLELLEMEKNRRAKS